MNEFYKAHHKKETQDIELTDKDKMRIKENIEFEINVIFKNFVKYQERVQQISNAVSIRSLLSLRELLEEGENLFLSDNNVIEFDDILEKREAIEDFRLEASEKLLRIIQWFEDGGEYGQELDTLTEFYNFLEDYTFIGMLEELEKIDREGIFNDGAENSENDIMDINVAREVLEKHANSTADGNVLKENELSENDPLGGENDDNIMPSSQQQPVISETVPDENLDEPVINGNEPASLESDTDDEKKDENSVLSDTHEKNLEALSESGIFGEPPEVEVANGISEPTEGIGIGESTTTIEMQDGTVVFGDEVGGNISENAEITVPEPEEEVLFGEAEPTIELTNDVQGTIEQTTNTISFGENPFDQTIENPQDSQEEVQDDEPVDPLVKKLEETLELGSNPTEVYQEENNSDKLSLLRERLGGITETLEYAEIQSGESEKTVEMQDAESTIETSVESDFDKAIELVESESFERINEFFEGSLVTFDKRYISNNEHRIEEVFEELKLLETFFQQFPLEGYSTDPTQAKFEISDIPNSLKNDARYFENNDNGENIRAEIEALDRLNHSAVLMIGSLFIRQLPLLKKGNQEVDFATIKFLLDKKI